MESRIANSRSWPLDYLSEVSFEDPFDVVFKLWRNSGRNFKLGFNS